MHRPHSVVFLILFLMLPIMASAVDPPPVGDDAVLCLYTHWDEENGPADGDIEYPAWVPLTYYPFSIVLYHIEGGGGLGGVEFSIHVEQGEIELLYGVSFMLFDVEYMPGFEGDYLNIGEDNDVFMGLSEPAIPINGGVHIMQGNFFFLPSVALDQPITVRFGPCSTPSVPGQMSYVDFGDISLIQMMVPNNPTGDLDQPVFSFGIPVATESMSLSSIKGLFN